MDRFEVRPGDRAMKAVVTTGNGGYDRLVYRDVPVPSPGPDEVLIRVLAAGGLAPVRRLVAGLSRAAG